MNSCQSELEYYLNEGIINEVHGLINEGKEAMVFLATTTSSLTLNDNSSNEEFVAIKVFKNRQNRSFKNRRDYFMQTISPHRREARALAKKSSFGIKLEESIWHSREINTLKSLFNSGADVPKIHNIGENSFVMDYIGDKFESALRLSDLRRNLPNPYVVYETIIKNFEIFLSCDIIHGDLSPYNILYYKNRTVIIDFPQAVILGSNSNCKNLFIRDFENIRKFFINLGLKNNFEKDLNTLLKKYF